jgi:hypothetical protein
MGETAAPPEFSVEEEEDGWVRVIRKGISTAGEALVEAQALRSEEGGSKGGRLISC